MHEMHSVLGINTGAMSEAALGQPPLLCSAAAAAVWYPRCEDSGLTAALCCSEERSASLSSSSFYFFIFFSPPFLFLFLHFGILNSLVIFKETMVLLHPSPVFTVPLFLTPFQSRNCRSVCARFEAAWMQFTLLVGPSFLYYFVNVRDALSLLWGFTRAADAGRNAPGRTQYAWPGVRTVTEHPLGCGAARVPHPESTSTRLWGEVDGAELLAPERPLLRRPQGRPRRSLLVVL